MENFFAWIGGGIYGKIFDDSPLKEFEIRESVVSLVDVQVGNALTKICVFSDRNPLLNNSILKEISENSNYNTENSKIKSVIEEKKSVESNDNKEFKDFAKNKCENKTFNQTQHINISIQATPNQDVCSLADKVIKRIREKSRDVLFDTVETFY